MRNGLDYLQYQQYERALKFLREAEAREKELTAAERQQLKQGIEQAQSGLRAAADAATPYALSDRSRHRSGFTPARPEAETAVAARAGSTCPADRSRLQAGGRAVRSGDGAGAGRGASAPHAGRVTADDTPGEPIRLTSAEGEVDAGRPARPAAPALARARRRRPRSRSQHGAAGRRAVGQGGDPHAERARDPRADRRPVLARCGGRRRRPAGDAARPARRASPRCPRLARRRPRCPRPARRARPRPAPAVQAPAQAPASVTAATGDRYDRPGAHPGGGRPGAHPARDARFRGEPAGPGRCHAARELAGARGRTPDASVARAATPDASAPPALDPGFGSRRRK